VSPPYLPEASPVTPPIPKQDHAPLKGYLPAQIKQPPGVARPAYSTAVRDRATDSAELRPNDVRHVVQNSDTLEKLAKRYLGDKRRALEIFDLNRDVLDNPHLLPIDAELRIPARADRPVKKSTNPSG
jgi:nucleoid-associated protein YgaU